MNRKPNVLLIVCDDMGYSDPGCFGGEIDTPNLDRLAANGLRFTRFYSSARCAPSRASLLSGLHPHQTGIGILTYDDGPDGYPGNLNRQCVTMAEVLKVDGYRTYLSGKWHLAKDAWHVNDTWPLQRGFDRFFGTLAGSGSYYQPHTLARDNELLDLASLSEHFYYTDAVSDEAVRFLDDHLRDHPDKPFFQYVAFTAPHWPLHAPEETIAKYKGRFDQGWDVLRRERLERMIGMGLLDPDCRLSERDPGLPPWEEEPLKEWRLRCMEVYAAQVERMDRGIGRIVDFLEAQGELERTVLIFLSDNGGCAEEIKPHLQPGTDLLNVTHNRQGEPIWLGNHPEIMPGAENTFQTYSSWANLSNTPFRLYKSWVHEGGIASPLIVHAPQFISERGALRNTPGQLTDIMATVLDMTGASYPKTYRGHEILPPEGRSLLPVLNQDGGEPRYLYWEHQGNAAIRYDRWKLVRNYPGDWELYDVENDRTETCEVSSRHPEQVGMLAAEYERWAERCRVIPRETILGIPGRRTHPSPYFGWMI